MPQLSPTTHRTIVFVDVADFTNPSRNVPDLLAVQAGVYEVLKTAFAESGVDFDSCDTEDRGDGALILIPPDVSKSQLADLLPDRLVAAIRRYNATRMPAARFKLRVGIHAGDIRRNANSWVGHAMNLTARIVEVAEVKSALSQSDGLVALVASNYFYGEVIEQDPGVAPESYRRIEASVKTFSGVVWLRIPGETVSPARAELPTSARELPAAPSGDPTAGNVLGLLAPEDREVLRGWLSDLEVPHTATLVARAAGPAIPPPRDTSAWEVFCYLSDFNADPEGVPPAFAYLKLLATELGGEFQATLSPWVEQQARRLRLAPVLGGLTAGREPILEQPHLHLMIVVEPDAIDPDRCTLSFWRQDDPLVWPPTRGSVREVAVDDLEYRVDEIILDAERAWAGQVVSVAIEFVLARRMLTLPVHRWRKEHQSGDPRPLAFDYQLGLRSLERMRTTYWHRQWKVRWRSVLDNSPGVNRIHPFGPKTPGERIDAALSDPRWAGLVMAQPPSPQPEPGTGPDVLTAALRAGLPLICWHPKAAVEDLREHVDWLLSGDHFIDLPERHRVALQNAASDDEDPVYDLAIMWDDPYRVIIFDRPSIPIPE